MTVYCHPDYLTSLVHELIKLPDGTGWAEFKHNIAGICLTGPYKDFKN